MDVWFCIEQEQSPRGKNRERKNLKKLFTHSSRARQESFFLLTRTYHGSLVGEMRYFRPQFTLRSPRTPFLARDRHFSEFATQELA